MNNPEIFVVDFGATRHSTGYATGTTNWRTVSDVKTMVGNGETVMLNCVADLQVEALNSKGQKQCDAVLTDVVYSKTPFNILSAGRLLMKGFEMSGTLEKGYVFTKGNI